MKQLLLIYLLFIPFISLAQTTIILDDFDGNNLNTNWIQEPDITTFLLTESGGELKVTYNRDVSSTAWDQFHVNFDNTELNKYTIKLDIRSNVAFQLTLKPVYTDDSNDWLQKDISGGDITTTVSWPAGQSSNKTLNLIYFYFDGGSTAEKSGVVYIDNITIEIAPINENLLKAINFAQLFHDNSTEGNNSGQFESGSKSSYQTAINAAQSVADNSSATLDDINTALINLNDATHNFESKVVIDEKVTSLSFADDNATVDTKNLYYNLKEISNSYFLFGMQDATGYGVGWTDDNDRSDVKDVCGSYPAVGAWAIKQIAEGNSFEGEEYRMSKFFNLGGINTVEWHMDNPYGGDFYWENHPDKSKNVVASLLPGGEYHNYYKKRLDNIAHFARNLKGEKGQSIPIIFRPFHEHNGDWFWWGRSHCQPAEYIQLWRFTVDYLKSKKVNNFLYAYSPDRFSTEVNYLERYPGDDYVDILGFDDYWDLRYYEGLDLTAFVNQLGILTDLANTKNKVAALTECGYEGVKYNKWFTEVLLDPIKNDTKAKRIAYAAVWRNANETHHYAPYPGHASADDFVDFYNDTVTIFIDNIFDMYQTVLDIAEPVGFEMHTTEIKAQVYPNPASNTLIIKSDEPIKSIELYQLNGAKLMQLNNIRNNHSELNINSIPKGIYMLKIVSINGKRISKKLAILR